MIVVLRPMIGILESITHVCISLLLMMHYFKNTTVSRIMLKMSPLFAKLDQFCKSHLSNHRMYSTNYSFTDMCVC